MCKQAVMNVKTTKRKTTKREAQKKEERRLAKEDAILKKRVAKANYLIAEAVRKEFQKGGSAHDVFFHLILKDVKFAARFLNAYLPRKLRKALDLSDPSRIKVLSTDLYEERVKKHIADFIFVVPCKEENKFVSLTLIIEHKAQSGATIDRKTILQVTKYVTLELEELLKKSQNGEVVYQPLVVIIYTGANPNFVAPSWETSFPLPQALQVKELRGVQIRFTSVCVNLTRLFLEDKLVDEDFLRVVPEVMARASLKRLKESYPTLFRALGSIKNITSEDKLRLNACVNYVALTADQPLSSEEVEILRQSAKSENIGENMKNFLDLLEEKGEIKGEIKGKIKGKIETIQTVASLRFAEPSKRLPPLLKKLDDLELLDQIRQFSLTAPSLLEIENYAENLTQSKSKLKRVARKRAS